MNPSAQSDNNPTIVEQVIVLGAQVGSLKYSSGVSGVYFVNRGRKWLKQTNKETNQTTRFNQILFVNFRDECKKNQELEILLTTWLHIRKKILWSNGCVFVKSTIIKEAKIVHIGQQVGILWNKHSCWFVAKFGLIFGKIVLFGLGILDFISNHIFSPEPS